MVWPVRPALFTEEAMSRLKTMGPWALAGVLAFTLAGCAGGGGEAPAAEEPQIDLAAEKEAVRQVNVNWLEQYRARDAEGIGALFVEDGWTVSGTDGLSEGRAAIVATNQEDFVDYPEATGDWGGKQVWIAASGDLAVERGWYAIDNDADGEGEAIAGEYLTVFTKVGGEWKVLADSSVPLVAEVDED
jgi:ketosteroid isomerase-like protein